MALRQVCSNIHSSSIFLFFLTNILLVVHTKSEHIVVASFNQIIVATNKRRRADARAYWAYVSAYMSEEAECAEVFLADSVVTACGCMWKRCCNVSVASTRVPK